MYVLSRPNKHGVLRVVCRGSIPAIAVLLCAVCAASRAQQRIEVGLFVDYIAVSQSNTNNFGLGGRFGLRVHRKLMLEGEAAYGYGINFSEAFRNITNGNIAAIQRTSIGVTHGVFGPKLQPAKERGLHPFATLKFGFIDFRLSPSLLPLPPLASTLVGLRDSRLNPVLYPAAGVEPSLGPLGLRLEFGDEIYFSNGAHNNLRITFGPTLRF
jgi:hypothetical protein